MKHAIRAALSHAHTNTRCAHIGCSLLIDGKHVKTTTNCPSAHAEARIIDGKGLFKRYGTIDIIVIRIKKEPFGELAMAKPCKHCLDLYKELGVRGVYYSDETGRIRYELVKDMKNDHISKSKKFL